MMSWFKKSLPSKRRLVQLYAALLYNAYVKGYIQGNIYTGNLKIMCVPGLNCYSCPGAVGACPLGALQNAVASAGHRVPAYVLGIVMLYGLIWGRTICGFLCPFGLIQELLHKIPTPKLQKGRATRTLSGVKYLLLIVFIIGVPAYFALKNVPLPAFCKYICPAGTLEGAVGLLANPVNADKYSMLGQLFTSKFLILLLVVGICVFVYRAFCRFLCPLGAIYGLFSKIAIIGVKVEPSKCVDCGRCVNGCKMDIRHVGDHECIHCGECISMCHTSAISFKAGKYTICSGQSAGKRSIATKWITGITALLLLVGVMIFVNMPDTTSGVPESNSHIDESNGTLHYQIGSGVGMMAPSFSAPVYGQENIFNLSEYRGKVVVLNFWATWCTPCINELPYFDEVYRMYPDDVMIVALHSHLVTDSVEAFLDQHDYSITFAQDPTGEIIHAFDGSTMLPQTVIIDREGIIRYNAVGSLTSEKLNGLIKEALDQ